MTKQKGMLLDKKIISESYLIECDKNIFNEIIENHAENNFEFVGARARYFIYKSGENVVFIYSKKMRVICKDKELEEIISELKKIIGTDFDYKILKCFQHVVYKVKKDTYEIDIDSLKKEFKRILYLPILSSSHVFVLKKSDKTLEDLKKPINCGFSELKRINNEIYRLNLFKSCIVCLGINKKDLKRVKLIEELIKYISDNYIISNSLEQ